jgi:hypothetical protein
MKKSVFAGAAAVALVASAAVAVEGTSPSLVDPGLSGVGPGTLVSTIDNPWRDGNFYEIWDFDSGNGFVATEFNFSFTLSDPSNLDVVLKGVVKEGHPEVGGATLTGGPGIAGQSQDYEEFDVYLNGVLIGGYDDSTAQFEGADIENAYFLHELSGSGQLGLNTLRVVHRYATANAPSGQPNSVDFKYQVFAVPTPGALALLGLGGVVAGRRRR